MQQWNTINVQAAAVHKVTASVWENTMLTSHLKAKHTGRQGQDRQARLMKSEETSRLNWAGAIYPYFTFLHHLLLYNMSILTRAFYGTSVRGLMSSTEQITKKENKKSFITFLQYPLKKEKKSNLDKRIICIQNKTSQGFLMY